jgi:ABC-type Mn2+/Zn2+ transport system ATPase subunit
LSIQQGYDGSGSRQIYVVVAAFPHGNRGVLNVSHDDVPVLRHTQKIPLLPKQFIKWKTVDGQVKVKGSGVGHTNIVKANHGLNEQGMNARKSIYSLTAPRQAVNWHSEALSPPQKTM